MAIGDLTSAEEVNRALGCVMDWLNACCDRFNIVIQHRTYFQQFVESCKKVLPALPDKRELDYTHEVTEDELNAVNQYAKDILKVYGGADFIVDWSKREGNEGCSYPVNADTDIEFTKDNVQFMVSDIVSRAYYENNEEEKKDGIWNNWNYMHELMNLKTISLKQNDDLAHLIIEAIGWQVPKYEKPVSLEITLPDEIELGEGEQHYTYQRFANLESALALVNDERADYDIMISRCDSLTLEESAFSGKYRELTIRLCDQALGHQVFYNGTTLKLNGNARVEAGRFQFNDTVTIEGKANQKVVLCIQAENGTGNVDYQKE